MKLLGTTYIELDDMNITLKYSDYYQLGDIGRIAHIIHLLYSEERIADYLHKK